MGTRDRLDRLDRDQENPRGNRKIAQNEAIRQTTGDIRVSAWAIVLSITIGLIAVGIVWVWLAR